MVKRKYPFYIQYDRMDCGPSCLRMICKFYGKTYSLDYLREIMYIGRQGVDIVSLSSAAEQIGFRTMMVQITYEQLLNDCPTPCILFWNQEHYVVLYDKNTKKRKTFFSRNTNSEVFKIGDPAHGVVDVDKETLLKAWISNTNSKGVCLIIMPKPEFFEEDEEVDNISKDNSFKFLYRYVKPYRGLVFQIIMGMILGSLISLIFPFLTQNLVDYGIGLKNYNIVILILVGQLLLFFGETAISLIRSWILLHMNTRVSISIVSDFLHKLMNLPLRFFDIKSSGDIFQRINDHSRVESFLTSTSFNAIFSIINIVVFSFVLAIYSWVIFGVFISLSVLSIIWVIFFLRYRKSLDYKRFQRMRESQDSILEVISGMQEIKLNNCETTKRWAWERTQVKLFKIYIKSLTIDQLQRTGYLFINQFKNIILLFIAASFTIEGNLTLGMLLSISYIIGQTNGPLFQLIDFFVRAQDAQLSLERLQEIHSQKEEEKDEIDSYRLDEDEDIQIQNLSFQYGGPHSKFVLDNINLKIPHGKVTAIVGASGSGKTTLLKLLLQFYPPIKGRILAGDQDLMFISKKSWRNSCAAVMQDGYIFSDTIARNIAIDGGEIDRYRLLNAAKIANLSDFVSNLPTGYRTLVGKNGEGLSGGEKQRLLIARAIYKDPDYLFLDEATSALDANNEKVIINKLNKFFEGKTVLIIAHRLSTVKNADQIVVLENGQIVEVGKHEELTKLKGKYYTLVKNQLELGN